MIRSKVIGIVAALAAILSVAGCGSAAPRNASGPATSTRNPVLMMNRYSAADLANLVTGAGLPMPHVHDVSRRDCPAIGCTDEVESDTVSVMTFPSSGSAEIYSRLTDHSFQLLNVVMVFRTGVGAQRTHAYENVVTHALT